MAEEMTSRNERYSRDLLKRFADNSSSDKHPEGTGGDSDEIELSLGLSLGGCVDADAKGKKLFRSSSIASFSSLPTESEFPMVAALSRTSSLPTETEEERRNRKVLQSLKRLEAKRKRSDKRNSWERGTRVDEDGHGEGGQSSPPLPPAMKVDDFAGGGEFGGVVNGVTPPGGLLGWAASSGQVASRPIPQGSIGSQGSSSSGFSEYDSLPKLAFDMSGITSCTEARSAIHKMAADAPTSVVGKATGSAGGGGGGGGEEDPARKNAGRDNGMKEMERNMLEEMPCVSTTGDGPNGRRIEGFLYKYRKGEEVRIVCVCHGSFLTPAEFVRHAGGGDVAHPLRHIVVNPSPFAFL